jgi:hypothetical protein
VTPLKILKIFFFTNVDLYKCYTHLVNINDLLWHMLGIRIIRITIHITHAIPNNNSVNEISC